MSRLGKLDAKLLALPAEESVGDLGEYPGPVARLGVAPRRPPVLQVVQDLEALLDRLPRPAPVEPRYEPEPASIVLVHGVVKSGSRGQQVLSYGVQGAERPFLHELPTEHKWVTILLHTSIW